MEEEGAEQQQVARRHEREMEEALEEEMELLMQEQPYPTASSSSSPTEQPPTTISARLCAVRESLRWPAVRARLLAASGGLFGLTVAGISQELDLPYAPPPTCAEPHPHKHRLNVFYHSKVNEKVNEKVKVNEKDKENDDDTQSRVSEPSSTIQIGIRSDSDRADKQNGGDDDGGKEKNDVSERVQSGSSASQRGKGKMVDRDGENENENEDENEKHDEEGHLDAADDHIECAEEDVETEAVGITPKGPKLPVVVFIHGGGWKRGDRNYVFDVYNNIARLFTSHGYVCVVPSYRLSMTYDGNARHPDHVADIAHVLLWVKENIGRYNGDEDMVFLCGHSAGGHLSALVSLDHRYLDSVGLSTSFVKGVVGLCGVYDLFRNHQRFLARYLYLSDAFGNQSDILVDASPVAHVHANAPPFFLVNAEKDLGLEEDTKRLKVALESFDGNEVEVKVYPGTSHGSIIGLSRFGNPHAEMVKDVCKKLDGWVETLKEKDSKKKTKKRKVIDEDENEEREDDRELISSEN